MTDQILLAIKGDTNLQTLADKGSDNALADKLNANLPVAVPITVQALMAAAPTTLTAIGSGSNPLAEMEVIASRVRAGDSQGVGAWATTLHMLGKMSDAEFAAVESLVSAATPQTPVTHEQVTASLKAVRPTDADGVVRAGAIDWSKV